MAEKPVAVFMNTDFGKRRFKPETLRWVLAGVILATLIALITIFIGYRRLSIAPEGEMETLKLTRADIALNEIRHTATRDGKDEWTLTAKSAQVLEDRNKTVIDSPSVVFFLKDGGKVYLTANKGILKTESNDLEAVGDVTVKNDDYVLKTEHLLYDHNKRLIISSEPVLIEGARISLAAERLVYDLATQTSTFKGKVESTLHENISL